MIDLTPETLAELRRLLAAVDGLHGTPRRGGKTYARETLAAAAMNALPALLDAAAERDALREQIEAMQSTDGLSIMSGWLVYEVGKHNCGGYGPESNYMHEPGCGYEPIIDLSKMKGWPGAERDALAAKVARVRALHYNDPYPHYMHPGIQVDECVHCLDEWPCETIRALDEELQP